MVKKVVKSFFQTVPKSFKKKNHVFIHCQEIQLAKYYAAPEDKRNDIELNPHEIIKGAIENCRPLMLLQKVKVGSVTYYVPVPVSESRSYFEAIRWIHKAGEYYTHL